MEHETTVGRHRYLLQGRGYLWHLERWTVARDGYDVVRFELDYDKRHRRLFLSDMDERFIGVEGMRALEKLAREALGEPGEAR